MQKLKLEPAWEKTVSTQDRNYIEEVFQETSSSLTNDIELTELWEAKNHKGELLVTALIQNNCQQPFTFLNQKVRYLADDKVLAENIFNLPSLIIEAKTSVPWTFMFPVGSFEILENTEIGQLEIVK